MKATFKLINSYFWKTLYGPILAFIFPVMLLGILGNIMRIEYVYPGIIALNMLFLGVLALPLAIMELKGSMIFKYIGSSPVNPLKFSIVVILYYILISLITGALTLTATIIIFYDKIFPDNTEFKNGVLGGLTTLSGFFSFIFASFFHLILVITFGLAIATFSKTPQQALTFAIIIIIPSMFLTGMVVTVDIIAKSQTMQWISRFIPFRYSTANLVVASTPFNQLGDIFTKLSISEKELIFGVPEENELVINDSKSIHYGSIKLNLSGIDESIEKKDDKNIYIIMKEWGWKKNDSRYLSSSKEISDFIVKLQKADSKISVKEIFNETMSYDASDGASLLGDFFLFKNILINPDSLNNSDNNIFQLDQEWSVRKVMSSSDIKLFVQNYLSGEEGRSKNNLRFVTVAAKISDGDLRFLEMFFKQTVKLYSIPERSLNLCIPLVFTIILGVYINKKFTWTSR